jgi:phosphate transport system permease protein
MPKPSSSAVLKDKESLYFRWRLFLDRFMRHGVAFGGISIIIAITLIFLYLLIVVFPIFQSASVEKVASYASPAADSSVTTLHMALEEQNEVALQITGEGRFLFFDAQTGKELLSYLPALPKGVRVTSFANADPARNTVALGLSNGHAIVLKHHYKVSYPEDKRLITPQVEYPLGKEAVLIDTQDSAISTLAVENNEEGIALAAATEDDRIVLVSFQKEESFLDDSIKIERVESYLPYPASEVSHLLIDKDQRELYIASEGGNLTFYDIQNKTQPKLLQALTVTHAGAELTALRSLTGGISILVGGSDGHLAQWSLIRNENNQEQLIKFREFEKHQAAITQIVPEFSRKGFIAKDSDGVLGIYHTTAERTVLRDSFSDKEMQFVALSPRANGMLLLSADNQIEFWKIHNEHPEISWKSLWGKVRYESYEEPQYMWQSSSASNDFEPKFSLVPISFGTLKAAFYAMLIAVPLAIMGAIFTSQFMSPRMRRVVKPSIEIMEALPTVILGFLAGLWLAPLMEDNLPGIFSLLLILPPGILLAAYLWQRAPQQIRYLVPDGWESALLIPVVLVIGWISFSLSPAIENVFFGGDMPQWLSTELGISFDQRNSLVVGLAMGFAVIPTIFSIAEDALFAVPKHLIHGSLALGATPWQTLSRVVILTASPGIFSAVMIGMGRAVGETMIVLMATGNTPVMDFSIFQGMRTLSANIAVEMPESEVDSTHYRVLFLAALVLFAFTFLFNTAAEVVRQRLRRKYSSL